MTKSPTPPSLVYKKHQALTEKPGVYKGHFYDKDDKDSSTPLAVVYFITGKTHPVSEAASKGLGAIFAAAPEMLDLLIDMGNAFVKKKGDVSTTDLAIFMARAAIISGHISSVAEEAALAEAESKSSGSDNDDGRPDEFDDLAASSTKH